MCMAVYIGSEVPLRTWQRDLVNPGFHVTEVSSNDEAVKRHFSKPHVYYAGAFEGCGCGFQERPEEEINRDRLAAADACRADIERYVREALTLQRSVEIYACSSGNEAAPPATTRAIDTPSFPDGFEEGEFLVVGRSAVR